MYYHLRSSLRRAVSKRTFNVSKLRTFCHAPWAMKLTCFGALNDMFCLRTKKVFT